MCFYEKLNFQSEVKNLREGTSVCEKLVFQSVTKNEIRGDRGSMKNYSFEVKRKIKSAGVGICEKWVFPSEAKNPRQVRRFATF